MQINNHLRALLDKFLKYRFAGAIAAIISIGLGALFLFWPVLIGKNLLPSFILYHYYYFTVMKHFVYDLGMLPLWWPAYDSGYPINLTLDAFWNPIFLLMLKFFSAFTANNWLVFIFFVLNGLSLYAFARELTIGRSGSIVAAIAYAFSGVIVKYTPVTGIVALMPFLPLAFLFCSKILSGKTRWFWPWLLLLCYSLIGGWSEMIIYALVAVGFYAAYLIACLIKDGTFNYRNPLLFFGAVGLSGILLSPWILSVLNFVGYSNRAGGMANAGEMPTTLSHLLFTLFPRLDVFYGNLLPVIPLADYGYFFYIGTLPLLLIIATPFIQNKKAKGDLLFFIALAAGAFLMTVNHSPLFWLFHQIPVLAWFRGYWKWSFVLVFASALLAGYGLDNIRDFFHHRLSRKIIITIWAIFLLGVISAGIFTVFHEEIKNVAVSYGTAHYKSTEGRIFSRSADYYANILGTIAESVTYNFSFRNGWLLLMAGLWLLALAHITAGKFELLTAQYWRLLAIPVTMLGSVLVWTNILVGPPIEHLRVEPSTARYLHSAEPYLSNQLPLDETTAQTLTPYRTFIYTPDRFIAVLSEKYNVNLAKYENSESLSRELMDDNMHIFFNFDTFYNHQTLAMKRLLDILYFAKKQGPFTKASYADNTSFTDYIKAFSAADNFRLLGALNIKYVLTPIELGNGLTPVFITDEAKVPVYIYKNPYFLPRWYFAENIKWANTDTTTTFNDLRTVSNFTTTTLLEKLSAEDAAIVTKPNAKDKLTVELYAPGKLRIKTMTKSSRFLVFSESREPFWRAKVNGSPVPLYTANYIYQAVLVPPGENVVEFEYPGFWEQSGISARSLVNRILKR